MADKKKPTKKAAKSEAEVVKHKDGYRVELTDPSGKLVFHSLPFPTTKQAEAHLGNARA